MDRVGLPSHLALVGAALTVVAVASACGGSSCPPPRASDPEPAASGDEEAAAPALAGSYRILELAGEPVVQSLVRDPSCYAGRALFTFGEDSTLSFSLETACAGTAEYETVCAAELTTSIEWEEDGFRIPFSARARGMVSQFHQPASDQEEAADFDDSCHVGVSPMRWRIRSNDESTLELENEHGDVMRLERETSPEVDWRALTRRAHQDRQAPQDG